ncbi:MAG TPA: hypothetical protein VH353_15310 [Caulobacteraceae bacterium]|jgi:hypothetical protein|nr:hypothetical protein [Caulobacteraceae bacterium]
MKTKIGLVTAIGAAGALLAACGGNYYGGGDVGVGYAGPVALDDCGGYYDDYYGAIDDGCWADDGGFWYRGHGDRDWHRDSGGHFAHAGGGSMHAIHPTGPGHGFHFGGGHGGGGHGGGGGDHHG